MSARPSPDLSPELARIRALMSEQAARFNVDLVDTCPSTNTLLAERANTGAPSGTVLWTREQTAGRGRRGRPWFSRPGDSLTFSLIWRFESGSALAGLSLAVGLAVAQALEKLGAGGIELKWPNDVWLRGRKLGGILLELQQQGARSLAIIGVGLNLLPPAVALDQPTAGLAEALPEVEAAPVLAAVLTELGEILPRFAEEGFAPFQTPWMNRHALQAQAVRLIDDGGALDAVCLGVDPEGALLLEAEGKLRRILGGDVSLRGVR